MADVSIPGLATIAPVTGDSLPLERAATSLVDRRVTVDALAAFVQAGLTSASVGLGNVNNTSDANKPVSAAQTAAIAAAINVVVGSTVTASGTLALSALGAVTPVNSASATVQTLPSAASAFVANPYGLVVLAQKNTGAPTFAPAGSDLLRATSGVAASVQYGMIAAQVISATEWALA